MELIAENGTRLIINGNTIEIFGIFISRQRLKLYFMTRILTLIMQSPKRLKFSLTMNMGSYYASNYKSLRGKLWEL